MTFTSKYPERRTGQRERGPVVSTPGDRWEREAERVADDIASRAGNLRDLRTRMERATGADLSAVRLHIDPRADTLNRSQRSLAFTSGADVYFRSGQYAPDTAAGRHLIAHEMTHVAQQAAGGAPAVQHMRGLDAVRRAFGPGAAPAGTAFTAPDPEVLGLIERRGLVRALNDSTQVIDELDRWTESGIDRKLAEAARTVRGAVRAGRQVQLVHDLRALKQVARDWKAAYATRLAGSPELTARSQLVDTLDFGAKTAVGQSKAQGVYLQEARRAGRSRGLQALTDAGLQAAQRAEKDTEHGLTRAETAAIQIYTTNNFRYINPSIADDANWLASQRAGLRDDRAAHATNATLNQEGRVHAGVMMTAFQKLPESRIELWRGMRGTRDAMRTLLNRDFPVGPTDTKGVSSASRSQGTANHFMKSVPGPSNVDPGKNTAIEIHFIDVPSYDISMFSYNDHEQEQVILPGTRLVTEDYHEEPLAPDHPRYGALHQLGVRYLYRLVVRGVPAAP
ncbi:hypothetical protein GCM10023322_55870 [Rugosimonospora acidiphila]|uniref:eCIS core domain-containing protein n=1 Tax=Rugosimonospora acidiphila TaxID=556531 RepID=A0ABP9SCE8_9ACTN